MEQVEHSQRKRSPVISVTSAGPINEHLTDWYEKSLGYKLYAAKFEKNSLQRRGKRGGLHFEVKNFNN